MMLGDAVLTLLGLQEIAQIYQALGSEDNLSLIATRR